MITTFLLLFLAICVEIAATTSLKYTDGFRKIVPTVLALSGYAIAFYCLSIVVKTIPVGIAYALWCGLGIIGTSIAAFFFYKQKLNKKTIFGMSCILVGTIIMQLASN